MACHEILTTEIQSNNIATKKLYLLIDETVGLSTKCRN